MSSIDCDCRRRFYRKAIGNEKTSGARFAVCRRLWKFAARRQTRAIDAPQTNAETLRQRRAQERSASRTISRREHALDRLRGFLKILRPEFVIQSVPPLFDFGFIRAHAHVRMLLQRQTLSKPMSFVNSERLNILLLCSLALARSLIFPSPVRRRISGSDR